MVVELVSIIKEVNHCHAVWKRRKAERKLSRLENKQYVGQYIDEWEVS